MDQGLFQEIAETLKKGGRGVLATVVGTRGSVPRPAGAKLFYREDGRLVGSVGGGAVEATTLDRCREVLRTGSPRRIEVDITGGPHAEGACGGTVEIFLEPLGMPWRLIVVGAGHVGQAVASFASRTGRFHVLLLDDRPLPALLEGDPPGEFLQCERVDAALAEMKMDERDAVVIVTRCHAGDEEALEAVLGKDVGYVGMMGSRQKVSSLFDRLKERGADAAALDAVYAPIGLDIGAETPQELAVSILSEVLGVLTKHSMEHCVRAKRRRDGTDREIV